jgi:hypothetical protein
MVLILVALNMKAMAKNNFFLFKIFILAKGDFKGTPSIGLK